MAPAQRGQSPNHWTARELPRHAFLNTLRGKDDGKKAAGGVVVGGRFSSEQSIPAALSRLKAMRTGLSAGTLAVLIMWAPEPWPSSGSSSCKDKRDSVTLSNIVPRALWKLEKKISKQCFLILKLFLAPSFLSLHLLHLKFFFWLIKKFLLWKYI